MKNQREPLVIQRFPRATYKYWFHIREIYKPLLKFKIFGKDYIMWGVRSLNYTEEDHPQIEVTFDRLYSEEELSLIDREKPRSRSIELW